MDREVISTQQAIVDPSYSNIILLLQTNSYHNYAFLLILKEINTHEYKQTETTIKNKTKIFRVDADTGLAFSAVAELLNTDDRELLENVMASYVTTVRQNIVEVANKHPSFCSKYPFVG